MDTNNMGSIECVGVEKTPYTGNGQKFIKEFRGLKADFDKLLTLCEKAKDSYLYLFFELKKNYIILVSI